MDEEKYVRLRGRAHLGIAADGRLTLTMCNAKGDPLASPITFSNIPGKPAPPDANYITVTGPDGTKLNPPIMFLNSEMLVRLNQADFNHYKGLWQAAGMSDQWADAEIPNQQTMPTMNPTGPP